MSIEEYKKRKAIAAILDLLLIMILDAALLVPLLLFVHMNWLAGIPCCFGVHLLYGVLFPLSPLQGTPGLALKKLYICREDGENADIGRLLLRSTAAFFSGLLLGYGAWYALLDAKGYTVYDYVSGTKVQGIDTKNNAGKNVFLRSVGETLHGRSFPVDQNGTLIGRSRTSCGIVLPADEPCVSRIHCQVRFNQQTGMLLLRDVGSSYGTFIHGGEQLKKDQIAVLAPGEKFCLGNKRNSFMLVVPK